MKFWKYVLDKIKKKFFTKYVLILSNFENILLKFWKKIFASF